MADLQPDDSDAFFVAAHRREKARKRREGRLKRQAAQARSKLRRQTRMAALGWTSRAFQLPMPTAVWEGLLQQAEYHGLPVQVLASAIVTHGLRDLTPGRLDHHWQKYREAAGDVIAARQRLWLKRWRPLEVPNEPQIVPTLTQEALPCDPAPV